MRITNFFRAAPGTMPKAWMKLIQSVLLGASFSTGFLSPALGQGLDLRIDCTEEALRAALIEVENSSTGGRITFDCANTFIDHNTVPEVLALDVSGWADVEPLGKKVDLSIMPGSCSNPLNPSRRGLLPVVILGSADLDVRNIDLESLELAGIPVRNEPRFFVSIEDVAGPGCTQASAVPDGFPDLVLKFDSQAVVEAIQAGSGRVVEKGELYSLRVYGQLKQGLDTVIRGEDTITIVK